MKRHSIIFAVLAAALLANLAPGLTGGATVGGWKPIKNLKDPHVREIAEFAVSEYDKQSHASLKLVDILKGETQVVAGTNYRLVLEAKEGGATKTYEAVVLEKAWLNYRNLTSFKALKA